MSRDDVLFYSPDSYQKGKGYCSLNITRSAVTMLSFQEECSVGSVSPS